MIGTLVRRLLCRRGHHHVVRCAGAPDHTWTWNDARQRWTAELVPPAPRPVAVCCPHTPGGPHSVLCSARPTSCSCLLRVLDLHRVGCQHRRRPVGSDLPVRADRPPAGKNDLVPVAARHRA